MKFFIDSLSTKFPSIPNLQPHPRFSIEQATKYERCIKNYGGERLSSGERERADVLIVEEVMEDEYARWFAFDPRPIVVTPKFFEACLQTAHVAIKRWTPFTHAETLMLCKYIAHRVPELGAGGRSGNQIYRELEQHVKDFPNSPWTLASNHTWQSWREHYVKRRIKFGLDDIIDKMAKEASITSASQGTYSFDRRKVAYQGVQEREIRSVGAEGAPPRILRRPRSSNAEDGLDPSVKGVIDESDGVSVRKRRRTGGNHCREEFDGGPWSELELTLNNPPVLLDDAQYGPDDTGSSVIQ